LRREEVAVAAGLSTTWYTHLEQGRAKEVSPSVLDSLARALRLSEDERRHTHILMYGYVVGTEPIADEAPVNELLRTVVAATDGLPYPVYCLDRSCEVIAWNKATAEWFDDWASMPEGGRNFMHWLFTSDRAKQRIVDWTDFVAEVVARWRADLAKWPHDEIASKRVAQLKVASPEFALLWDKNIVMEHRVNVRRLHHPEFGIREFYGLSLFTAYEGYGGVLFYVPKAL
jgi:transcriptional regulator with XRE-family HTH domain